VEGVPEAGVYRTFIFFRADLPRALGGGNEPYFRQPGFVPLA
jgi:hypothetical protein